MKINFSLALVLILASVVMLAGCLQNPSDYKMYVLNASISVIKDQQCTCMMCTNGSSNAFLGMFTTGLDSGSCFFVENCSRDYLYSYLTNNKGNYVREFEIGQGATYTEYEQANLRCNMGEGYVVKVLYSKYRPPFYNQKKFGTFDSSEGDTVECALSKGAIPFYVIYTEGTYYESAWIKDFMKQTFTDTMYPTAPVFMSPEARFDKSKVKEISAQIDAIYEGCVGSTEKYCIDTDVNGACNKYETKSVKGCKVAVFPKQETDAEIFETLDALNTNYKTQMAKVSAVILTVNVDKEKYNCDAGLAIIDTTNRSRFVLNRYGKPSFLIFSIDQACSGQTNNIVLEFYSGITMMRMTGIFGAAYSQYFDYPENPLNNDPSKNAYSMSTLSTSPTAGASALNGDMRDWFALCKYYNSPPYKKEPITFQSNGVNLTQECDYLTDYPMLYLGQEELDKINKLSADQLSTTNTGAISYEPCIPEIDFGAMEDVAKGWTGWDSYTAPGMPTQEEQQKTDSGSTDSGVKPKIIYLPRCLEFYPKSEVIAERCGLSRHLVHAFMTLGVEIDNCKDWYDMEDRLNTAGIINRNNIDPTKSYESELGKAAFMYVLLKNSPDMYSELLDKKSDLAMNVPSYNLVSICNGVTIKKGNGESETVKNDLPCKVLKAYHDYRNECDMGKLQAQIKEQKQDLIKNQVAANTGNVPATNNVPNVQGVP